MLLDDLIWRNNNKQRESWEIKPIRNTELPIAAGAQGLGEIRGTFVKQIH